MFGTFSLQLNFFHTPLLQQSPFQSRDPPKIVQPRTAMCFALLFYHMAMIILGQPLPNFPFETERHRSCKHIRHPSFLESIKQHLETRASKRIINNNMFFGNHITIYALLSRLLDCCELHSFPGTFLVCYEALQLMCAHWAAKTTSRSIYHTISTHHDPPPPPPTHPTQADH